MLLLFLPPMARCLGAGAHRPADANAGLKATGRRPQGGSDLNQRSTTAKRAAFTGVALAASLLCASSAWALGLGRIAVQSGLGETMRAEIDVTSITPEEASSLRVRVATSDAYRAAGVDYNAALSSAQIAVVRRPDGRSVLRVTNDRAVLEPFVELIVEATWASGRLVREYTMLFDPPIARATPAPAAPAALATPAVVSAAAEPAPPPTAPQGAFAPAPAPAPAPALAPVPAASAQRTPVAPAAQATRPATPPPPAPSAAAASTSPDQVRVRNGDTLRRIAGRAQREGVSLDQMLVSLFRANPQAFMGENMNRMKSGSVLTVPSAEDAAAVDPPQAREVIVAQSADFDAYRQRLAAGAIARADAASARQDTGRVQAQVDDRKQGAAPTPDKLKLSRGSAAASAAEALASQETERKAADARLAELARNVDDLKKLQGAPKPGAAPARPAEPAPTVVAQAPVAPPPVLAAPVPAPVAPPPPPPAVAASAATAVAALASAPQGVVPPPPPPLGTLPPAVPKPPPVVEPPPAAEPSFVDSLLDNPLLLPGAGVLVLLLGGLGLYKLRGKMRKPVGETSFLESRLQPDSFFGNSGGQRVDTREAPASSTAGSSAMTYSLSQLDAIGDVDPVAEADVYLAYGRDLQAEEILKEAMRVDPERRAIRTKLLEVYAKRRDTKGFELLATQLFNLTKGEGDDWPKAQALGLTIDPENPLYQSGSQPATVYGARGQAVEPLGASTVPYTAPVGPPAFQPAADATLDGDVDLALDFELPDEPATRFNEKTAPLFPSSQSASLDFDTGVQASATGVRTEPAAMSLNAPAQPRVASKFGDLEFDLSDADLPAAPMPAPVSSSPDTEAALDFGDFSIDSSQGSLPAADSPEANSLARKLELAEEFRQIGDNEGARDLLEEVLSKSEGAVRARAQGMLDRL